MNRSMFIIFASLMIIAILVAPVSAKTKIEIKAVQSGSIDFGSADKVLITPNERIQQFWSLYGTGEATLMLNDDTVIDTFNSISYSDLKAKDSTTMGFADGVLVMKSLMRWESQTVDGGFEGVIQWRQSEGSGVLMQCVYQGFGVYEGQTLKMEGVTVPGLQSYTGILIA